MLYIIKRLCTQKHSKCVYINVDLNRLPLTNSAQFAELTGLPFSHCSETDILACSMRVVPVCPHPSLKMNCTVWLWLRAQLGEDY